MPFSFRPINEKDASLEKAAKDVTKSPKSINKNFWDKNDKLHKEIRKNLLNLAKDIWDGMEHADAALVDITFTGSLTGERWSTNSDVDLHLIVKFGETDEELMNSYFQNRSKIWNSEHDIEILGFPVEIYVQNADQEHHSAKVYSLLQDKWIVKKDPGEFADFGSVSKKAKTLAKDIRIVLNKMKKTPSDQNLKAASKITEKLRKMRSTGLEEGGEGSIENLAYKALRRAGLLDKLKSESLKTFDKLYSL